MSGLGSEVEEAGTRFVEKVSNDFNKIREQDSWGRVDLEVEVEGDRSVWSSHDQSAWLTRADHCSALASLLHYRFWGKRCILDDQCAYLTLGNTNLQVSSCDKSYFKGDKDCVMLLWCHIFIQNTAPASVCRVTGLSSPSSARLSSSSAAAAAACAAAARGAGDKQQQQQQQRG